MASASRVRSIDELLGDGPCESPISMERVVALWPRSDYADIAKELGAPRERVAFVVHPEPGAIDRRSGNPIAYRLTATFGEGEDYDPTRDPRAMQRTMLETVNVGARAAAIAPEPAPTKKS